MPVISYFFGIYIRMYHDDHNTPHFYAEYQGHQALIVIGNGEILEPVRRNAIVVPPNEYF